MEFKGVVLAVMMKEHSEGHEGGEKVRTRFGRRFAFGGGVAAVLGIGALVVIALSMRRRATTDATREPDGTARERLGEDRERRGRHDTDSAEHVSDGLKAEAESAQVASQEVPAQGAQQRGREKAGEVLAWDIEERGGSTREEIRRAKGHPVRLRSRGQRMMSVLRGSVRRSRGGA